MSNPRTLYSTKVEKIIDYTPQIRELIIKTDSPQDFVFKCGQFVMLHVPQENAKPGLRAYSIASDDRLKNGFRLIFKFVENGLASNYVWKLKEGDTVQFTGPFGKVFFQEPPSEQIIFLNTGSGVSQHLSYLLSKSEQYPLLKYRMLFGLRSESDIYLQEELTELSKKIHNFKFEYVLSRPSDTWTGKKGYIQHFLKEYEYKNTPTTFYLCGNGGMIKEVKNQLLEIDGLDKSRVWSEAFD